MSEQTGAAADDPYGGRRPTTHERRAGQPWDASYIDGPAPWDTGGENALHVAALGLAVLGVDVAETALSIARENAAGRGIDAEFAVADALHLDRLGRVFATVLGRPAHHPRTTVIGHSGPGAWARRASAVTSSQARASANAT